jgi:hypothetical protein
LWARVALVPHVRPARYRRPVAMIRAALAAHFEVVGRRQARPQLGDDELDILPRRPPRTRRSLFLRRFGDFRGESRFTTWADKFALLGLG